MSCQYYNDYFADEKRKIYQNVIKRISNEFEKIISKDLTEFIEKQIKEKLENTDESYLNKIKEKLQNLRHENENAGYQEELKNINSKVLQNLEKLKTFYKKSDEDFDKDLKDSFDSDSEDSIDAVDISDVLNEKKRKFTHVIFADQISKKKMYNKRLHFELAKGFVEKEQKTIFFFNKGQFRLEN